MKKTLVLALLALASPLFAQEAPQPPELNTLRESWEKLRNAATAPIDKRYLDALEAMKVRFTRQSNLPAALAVDTEIQKILPDMVDASPKTFAGFSDRTDPATLRRRFINSAWLYKCADVEWKITFTGREACTWFNDAKKFSTSGKWVIKPGGLIAIIFPGEPLERVIKFNEDFSSGTVTVEGHPSKGGLFTPTKK